MLRASLPPPQHDLAPATDDTPVDTGLSVMTYNVKGLPWPLGMTRQDDLARIAERLRSLRQIDRHPRIVLLQEAFTDAAKSIGRDSGYRYIASGPSRELAAEGDTDPSHIAFVRAGDPLRGEGVGRLADSGLQILSDYPILAVRRAAFPVYACAGYDCLANKGMVMALIAIPGLPTPVAVINTHLNARKASGVSIPRALDAYRRQIDALERFVETSVPPHVPIIIAGDLNVGKSRPRRALMQASVEQRLGDGEAEAVLHSCFGPAKPCGTDLPEGAREAIEHNKDWQIVIPGRSVALAAHRIAVPFGREADGTMLSDHVGYVVHYRPGEPKKVRAGGNAGTIRTAMAGY